MLPPSIADLEEESKNYQLNYYNGKPIEIEFYKYSYFKLGIQKYYYIFTK